MLFRQYVLGVKKCSLHITIWVTQPEITINPENSSLCSDICIKKKKKREICFRTDAIRNTLSAQQSLFAPTVDIYAGVHFALTKRQIALDF